MTETMVSGLCFGEGPRWHEGALWFSDMHDHKVLRVEPDGNVETVVDVDTWPSGLGFQPDGTLLIVSMTDRRVLKFKNGSLSTHADLSALATFHCNDMVVDAAGRAYVGHFGFDIFSTNPERRLADLILVDTDGSARIAATDLAFPNGTVITPDGRTLIVGESMGARLTAFDVGADGSLSKRRVWAELSGAVPDGICLDAENCIWVASPASNEVLRVAEGGDVKQRIALDRGAFACMLGGARGNTLHILAAESSVPEQCIAQRSGCVLTAEVDVPRAGLP